MSALQIFGSLDIHRANEVMDEANLYDYEVAEYIHNYCEEAEHPLKDIDIVGMTYQYILDIVIREVEEKTGKYIQDNNDDLYVADNYLATSYDFKNEAVETRKLIKSIPDNERSETLKWFFDSIGGEVEASK